MPMFEKLRVLIVDDQDFMRRTLRQFLKQSGITLIAEAPDGTQALTQIAKFGPDLVLSDVEMTPMDGVTFLRLLRSGAAAGAKQDLPVVLLAGAVDARIVAAAAELKAQGLLVKPVSQAQVAKAVQQAMKGSPRAAPPPRPGGADQTGGPGRN